MIYISKEPVSESDSEDELKIDESIEPEPTTETN